MATYSTARLANVLFVVKNAQTARLGGVATTTTPTQGQLWPRLIPPVEGPRS